MFGGTRIPEHDLIAVSDEASRTFTRWPVEARAYAHERPPMPGRREGNGIKQNGKIYIGKIEGTSADDEEVKGERCLAFEIHLRLGRREEGR